MRIRTLSGDTMAAAMAKVREELGPDAIILHVEDAKSRKGVLVRAAAEALEHEARDTSRQDPQAHIETRLEQELRSRLRVFQPVRDTGDRVDALAQVAPILSYHRVPSDLAARLVQISGEAMAATADAALGHALERTIGCGPLPLKPARPVIALGAPGHGKTTALARLAAQSAAAGHSAVLITLDTGKAGAVSQIETYGALLKARVEICEDAERLAAIVKASVPGSAIYVDTPGLNPWDAAAVAQARHWIQAAEGEPVWIVSAETAPEDISETANIYRSLGARRMIATKLDMTRRWGAIAAAAANGPLALAGTIASAFLADGIEPPNHLAFARRLIEGANAYAENWTPQKEARTA